MKIFAADGAWGFWRRRAILWSRTIAAFAVTLIVIAGAYFIFIASQGHVNADLRAPLPVPPVGGSIAIATAASLLSVESNEAQSAALFLPDRKRRRLRLFQEGAAESVAAFVEVTARGRAHDRDKDLSGAADLLGAPRVALGARGARQYADAREALRRFNAQKAKAGRIDRSAKALAGLARAAAAASEANAQALRDAAVRGRFGPVDPDAEAVFFRARGHAYAWARLFSAFGQDMPALSPAPREALRQTLIPLGAAASFEPQILLNGPRGGIAPNHLEQLATDLAAAAAAARRLDKTAEPN